MKKISLVLMGSFLGLFYGISGVYADVPAFTVSFQGSPLSPDSSMSTSTITEEDGYSENDIHTNSISEILDLGTSSQIDNDVEFPDEIEGSLSTSSEDFRSGNSAVLFFKSLYIKMKTFVK